MDLPTVNPFLFPTAHARQHAPYGYTNYHEYKPWLRDEFLFRCVYCLQRERWSREGANIFGTDHLVPQSNPIGPALTCLYTNLVYACNRCNSYRQDCDLPVDPTVESIGVHVEVRLDGTVVALTQIGQEVIDLFHMDSRAAINERRRVHNILMEYAEEPDHPPHTEAFVYTFGFPDDLPDLVNKRPPGGNTLAENCNNCHHARQQLGNLPAVY